MSAHHHCPTNSPRQALRAVEGRGSRGDRVSDVPVIRRLVYCHARASRRSRQPAPWYCPFALAAYPSAVMLSSATVAGCVATDRHRSMRRRRCHRAVSSMPRSVVLSRGDGLVADNETSVVLASSRSPTALWSCQSPVSPAQPEDAALPEHSKRRSRACIGSSHTQSRLRDALANNDSEHLSLPLW